MSKWFQMMNKKNQNKWKIRFQDYVGTPIVLWLIFNIPVMLWFQSFGLAYVLYAVCTFILLTVYTFIGTKLKIWPFLDSYMRDE